MKIAVASDHGGFQLKKQLAVYLQKNGYSYHDFGIFTDEAVDYPDFALQVAQAVAGGEYALGVICCGTGVGVSIVANKVPGIRAANCNDTFSARLSREHNDANVLTLGERVLGCGLALEVLAAFLQGRYLGGRHACRVEKIKEIEAKFLGWGEAGR